MLTQHGDNSITLSKDRLLVCLDAAWELEALALALPVTAPIDGTQRNQHFVVRSMAARILQLSQVLLGCLDDSMEKTHELGQIVTVTHGAEP